VKDGVQRLSACGIDGLVIIGGNGSQRGALALAAKGVPVVGVASTIDNDLAGSDVTIGVDTALNVALEAVDRIKTTAASHRRAFLVEVMGRECGYLALMTGIAGGAEVVVLPEVLSDPEEIAKELWGAYERGKQHAIGVVAEGARWNVEALMKHFRETRAALGFELRATALGHIQRGGAPGAFDRILATRLGACAVEALAKGRSGVLIGLIGNRITETSLARVMTEPKPLDPAMIRLAGVLAQ
jgi:6-phosphofructokinase 1